MEQTTTFPVHATGQRVIVEVLSAIEIKTKSGLIIPSATTAKDKKEMPRGKVVSIGSKCDIQYANNTKIKEGDIVIYAASAGYPMMHEGKEYDILYEMDVIAVDKRD